MNLRSSGCDPGRAEEQLIGAVVPNLARPVPALPVPLSVLPPPPRQAHEAPAATPTVDAAQIDRSGRLQSSRVLRALRWRPADGLLVDLMTGPAGDVRALLVTRAHPDVVPGLESRHPRTHTPPPGSRCQIDDRGAITLPAAARALCNIDVGATVVLVAEPATDRLFAYPALLAARLLLAHVVSSAARPRTARHIRTTRVAIKEDAMRPDPARIAIARDVLAHLGITLADLAEAERIADAESTGPDPIAGGPASLALPARFAMPTLGAFLPRVRAAAGSGANRTYGSYWTTMERLWGSRRLDQITATDIEALQQHAASTARSRRNSRHGRHAGEHVIAAARAIYTRATADGYLTAAASPAHRVPKPRRLPSTRRASTTDELDQINTAARISGNDVILDALLLRLHTETPAAAAAPSAYGWPT